MDATTLRPQPASYTLEHSYTPSYGASVRFLEGLMKGELWGTRFVEDGPVYCPPRTIGPMGQTPVWVKLSGRGTVFAFQKEPLEEVSQTLAYIQPEGAITLLLVRLCGEIPDYKLEPGLAVKLERPEAPTGTLRDLLFAEEPVVEEAPAEEAEVEAEEGAGEEEAVEVEESNEEPSDSPEDNELRRENE